MSAPYADASMSNAELVKSGYRSPEMPTDLNHVSSGVYQKIHKSMTEPSDDGLSDASLVIPLEDWPKLDRLAWEAGTTPKTGLRRQFRYAERLRPRSIALCAKAYGRFLAVLSAADCLDPNIGPGDRVTFETVALFFEALRAAGNVDNTILSRMLHLRTAMRIMAPKINFGWIAKPNGVSIGAILEKQPDETPPPPNSAILFKWALEFMPDDPLPAAHHAKLRFCSRYRDGLIIAVLACRAPRLGSLAKMQIETNLYEINGEYWVRLQSQIVKNKRELNYSLPAELTPKISRYLAEIRPLLLDAAQTNALWGNGKGGMLTEKSIQTKIWRLTGRRFDRGFGPHEFRDALASTLAEFDPRNPGLAAVILGITEGVVNEHYRRARQKDAARKLTANLMEERARTRSVAQRELGQYTNTAK